MSRCEKCGAPTEYDPGIEERMALCPKCYEDVRANCKAQYTGYESLHIKPGTFEEAGEYTLSETGHLVLTNIGRCLHCGLREDNLDDNCPRKMSDEAREELSEALSDLGSALEEEMQRPSE